jgi:hypothetical protein
MQSNRLNLGTGASARSWVAALGATGAGIPDVSEGSPANPTSAEEKSEFSSQPPQWRYQ